MIIYCDPKIKSKNCQTYVFHGFCRACLEVPSSIKAVIDIRLISLCLAQLLPRLRICAAWQSLDTKISLLIVWLCPGVGAALELLTSCRRLKNADHLSCTISLSCSVSYLHLLYLVTVDGKRECFIPNPHLMSISITNVRRAVAVYAGCAVFCSSACVLLSLNFRDSHAPKVSLFSTLPKACFIHVLIMY